MPSYSNRARDLQTKELWVYDYRTNVHKTLKTKRLASGGFDDFIKSYHERRETERFRRFTYEQLAQRDSLPEPQPSSVGQE